MSFINKEKLQEEIENCSWYHIEDGELNPGARSDGTALFKSEDVFAIIDNAEAKNTDDTTVLLMQELLSAIEERKDDLRQSYREEDSHLIVTDICELAQVYTSVYYAYRGGEK